METLATTRLSSRGQVVIPERIRERLGLRPGTEFVVLARRDVVIFQVLRSLSGRRFQPLITEAENAARRIRIKRVSWPGANSRARRK